MTITTNIQNNDRRAAVKAKIELVLDYYHGPGNYILNTWGDARALLNQMRGSTLIQDREVATSLIDDINSLITLPDNAELSLDFQSDAYTINSTNSAFGDAITHSRSGLATMTDSDGLLKWAPHNLLTYSEDLTGADWAVTGTASIVDSETIAFGADDGSRVQNVGIDLPSGPEYKIVFDYISDGTFTLLARSSARTVVSELVLVSAEESTHIFTIPEGTDSVDQFWLRCETGDTARNLTIRNIRAYRSDLGGMVNNPDTGNSYVPTTDSAVYLPRRGHRVYNGSEWVNEGILHESEARTNYLLNSETVEQKEVYVTDQEYTVSFNSGSQFRSEIMETLAVTAVDVFVYDTSKDSDGGAWRTGALAQASSWYNETLNTASRGARREFPAMAVIVAESNKVTIYDGDDPALPMWSIPFGAVRPYNTSIAERFWRNTGTTSLSAKDGKICVGQIAGGGANPVNGGGVFIIDYLADHCDQRHSAYGGDTGSRGEPLASVSIASAVLQAFAPLSGTTVNDVAMTVLPDAPIDAATGLPVPTIAVATEGGVSVIKDDGTVVDSAVTLASTFVSFDEQKNLNHAFSSSPRVLYIYDTYDADGFGSPPLHSYNRNTTISAGIQNILAAASGQTDVTSRAVGSALALTSLAPDDSDTTKGMVAYTTSTYNTGWMNGSIKGAFLSDTDDTDLVGGVNLITDTSMYPLAMTGGTHTNTSASLVGGQFYRVQFDIQWSADAAGAIAVYATTTGLPYKVINVDPGNTTTLDYVTRAEDSGAVFGINASPLAAGTATISNPIVTIADHDRSVNNNGLIVNGTVTRSPVATGAELVAYSGFDYAATKYLSQPYNPGLAFGTGDFCLMWWNMAVTTVAQNRWLLGLYDPVGATMRLTAYMTSPGGLRLRLNNLEYATVNNTAIPAPDAWNLFAFVRKEGVVSLYRDGTLLVSQSAPAAINSATTDEFRIGGIGSLGPNLSRFALVRISSTAPTAEQIAKIYNDEKVLFQENAACTLYGSSDAVTALAHDPDTDLLHVGTSAGRSVFDGLRRIDNTTDAITTAISAVGGFIGEE